MSPSFLWSGGADCSHIPHHLIFCMLRVHIESSVTDRWRMIIFLNVIHWCLIMFWILNKLFWTALGFFPLVAVPSMPVTRLAPCFPMSSTEWRPWKAKSFSLSFSSSRSVSLFLSLSPNSCWQQDVITDGQLRGNLKPKMYFYFSCCQLTVDVSSALYNFFQLQRIYFIYIISQIFHKVQTSIPEILAPVISRTEI